MNEKIPVIITDAVIVLYKNTEYFLKIGSEILVNSKDLNEIKFEDTPNYYKKIKPKNFK